MSIDLSQAQPELRRALAARERSASWLARKAGVSPSLVARILSGERRPSPEFRRAAAEALEVPEPLLFPEGR